MAEAVQSHWRRIILGVAGILVWILLEVYTGRMNQPSGPVPDTAAATPALTAAQAPPTTTPPTAATPRTATPETPVYMDAGGLPFPIRPLPPPDEGYTPPQAAAVPGETWTGIANSSANIRYGPSTEYPVHRVAAAGDKVVVSAAHSPEYPEWLYLEDRHWVHSSLIDHAPVSEEQRELLIRHMVHLINRERTQRGLVPVVRAHNAAARQHADDMVRNQYISHWNLKGETPHLRYARAGGHDSNGENLSWSHVVSTLPPGHCMADMDMAWVDGTVAGLMDSPGHRRTILTPFHREVSIGLAGGCLSQAAVQVFEGEYVRFHRFAIADRKLTMSGWTARGLLGANPQWMLTWSPPLTAYTTDQVRQTYCYQALPVGEILMHAAATSKTTVVQGMCPAPWDADPHLRYRDNPAAFARFDNNSDDIKLDKEVTMFRLGASSWLTEDDRFFLEADLSPVIRHHGPGIYDVRLLVDWQGERETVGQYSVVVD